MTNRSALRWLSWLLAALAAVVTFTMYSLDKRLDGLESYNAIRVLRDWAIRVETGAETDNTRLKLTGHWQVDGAPGKVTLTLGQAGTISLDAAKWHVEQRDGAVYVTWREGEK